MIVSSFYWFEFRPIHIRVECSNETREAMKESLQGLDSNDIQGVATFISLYFDLCLADHGLER